MKTRDNQKFWINWSIAVAFFIAFICGVVGWQDFYFNTKGHPISIWTAIYLSFQMINLGVYPQDAWDRLPLILDIARFLMPLVVLSAIINLALSLTKKQFDRFIIWLFYRKHYIIIGANDITELIVNDMIGYTPGVKSPKRKSVSNRKKIILIDNEGPGNGITCLKFGNIKFIEGNPVDLMTLKRAKIRSAAYIIIYTDDDNKNLKIAEICKSINFKDIQKILIHFKDSLNLRAFKDLQNDFGSDQMLDFHGFDIYQKIAMRMIDQNSPDIFHTISESDPPVKILIYGVNNISEYFITEAAILYHFGNLKPLQIIIIDEHVEEKFSALITRYPGLDSVVKFEKYSPNDFFEKTDAVKDVSVCYIFSEHDYKSLNIAIRIRQFFAKSFHRLDKPKIIVLLPVNSTIVDFYSLLKSDPWKNTVNIDIREVRDFCTHKYLIEDIHNIDKIAQGIYESYQKSKKQKDTRNLTWKNLPDLEKDNNRYPVRLYAIMARYLGLKIIDLPEKEKVPQYDISRIPMSKRTVCSNMEHRRWIAEKIINGFCGGEKWSESDTVLNDNLKKYLKYHPSIKDFDALEEAEQKKDEQHLIEINTNLNCANQGLVEIKHD